MQWMNLCIDRDGGMGMRLKIENSLRTSMMGKLSYHWLVYEWIKAVDTLKINAQSKRIIYELHGILLSMHRHIEFARSSHLLCSFTFFLIHLLTFSTVHICLLLENVLGVDFRKRLTIPLWIEWCMTFNINTQPYIRFNKRVMLWKWLWL